MENNPSQIAQKAMVGLLQSYGEDMNRPGVLETPVRFVKQISECLSGYGDDPKKYVKLFPNDGYHGLVQVSTISFTSVCEHHLLPFYGYVDIAYVPGANILGLSKFARIVDAYSKRLQVQERLTQELADFLEQNLQSSLFMIRIRAKHTCMVVRGVLRPESVTDTLLIKGDTKKYVEYVSSFKHMEGKTL